MTPFICIFIVACVSFVSGYFSRFGNHYLNSSYIGDGKDLKPIELKVIKVEEVITKGDSGYSSRRVAKYTIDIYYLTKKNDVDSNTLYFYDEQGKYNVGDVLVFDKKNSDKNIILS